MRARRILLSSFILGGLCVGGPVRPAWAGDEPELMVPDGRTIFVDQGCARCHPVPAAGLLPPEAGTVSAPAIENLDGEYRKRWMRRWLLRNETHDGYTHLKAFDGTEEELKVLVDWLFEQ